MAAAFAQPRWRGFRLSKRGTADDDYEDAFAGDPHAGRFAVADGASEASFAGLWARALAGGFVNAPGKPWLDLDWLTPLRQEWATQVDALPLPWYAEEKREQGAFATLLGLVLRPPRPGQLGTWRALAVGDSCLVHARGERFLTSFPLTESAEFGTRPALLGSRPPPADRPPPCEHAHGRWHPGDRFLLMTDALAQWFLHEGEKNRRPLEAVEELLAEAAPEEAFAGWVDLRRDHAALRNDDVTLVVIDVGE
jgi:hypothetical protein